MEYNDRVAPRSVPMASTFGFVKNPVQRVPRFLRNRYVIAVLVLVGWITFFDGNDIWTTWKNQRELARMEDRKEWYAKEIERTREQLHELSSDKALLEKFARERYLMKRDNEDIFVLVEERQ